MNPNLSSNFLDPSIILPDEPEQLKYVLRDAYYNTAAAVNSREIATYALTEIVTGNQVYTIGNPQKFRSVYRKCFYVDSLAGASTKVIPHGITGITQIFKLEGTCVGGGTAFVPIPYVTTTDITGQIGILADATNITLINGAANGTLTKINIIFEYLKT